MPKPPSEPSAPDREADFQITDEIRRAIPEYPAQEVEPDVAETVAAARALRPAAELNADKVVSMEEAFGAYKGKVIFRESPDTPTWDDWEDIA